MYYTNPTEVLRLLQQGERVSLFDCSSDVYENKDVLLAYAKKSGDSIFTFIKNKVIIKATEDKGFVMDLICVLDSSGLRSPYLLDMLAKNAIKRTVKDVARAKPDMTNEQISELASREFDEYIVAIRAREEELRRENLSTGNGYYIDGVIDSIVDRKLKEYRNPQAKATEGQQKKVVVKGFVRDED